jgi:hypothetical protein
MLPVTTRKRTWISNRLAAVAALLLMASSMAGVVENRRMDGAAMTAALTETAADHGASISAIGAVDRAISRSRGFRMSLFLFPRG